MPKPKLVLLVGNDGPALLNFRGELIEAIAAAGHHVHVAAPGIDPPMSSEFRRRGATGVHNYPLTRTGLSPIRDWKTFCCLWKLLSKLRPDVVLAYTIKPAIWATLAARLSGAKEIIPVITGLGFSFTDGGGWRRVIARIGATCLYRLSLPHATTLLFLNSDDLQQFKVRGLLPKHRSSQIIHGEGIDLDYFKETPLPGGEASFLMVARLLGDKGVREFGAAARLLKSRYPKTIFRLVGYLDQSPDSITDEELEEIIAGGVDFVGRLDDVRPAIAKSAIYVLPSYREGVPRSTLEAMAMGRAVVTTDVPGCRETVEHGANGYIVPPRDVVSLANAMERFVLDPKLAPRFGAVSRAIAEKKFASQLINAEVMRHAGLSRSKGPQDK